ncbi:MAG: hypothetical protein LV477_12805, partial [Candidatus Nitrosotalea sp.]|nr:hypothetical protein [Candidatus Nitrosotalea sp.]
MDLKVLFIISLAAMLVFPQYAFSTDSGNSTSTVTNSTSSQGSSSTSSTNSSNTSSSNTSSNSNVSTSGINSTHTSTLQSNTNSITNSSNTSTPQPKINTTTTIVTIDPTSSAITPNLATVQPGSSISFSVKITDTSSLPSPPTGAISWSDGSVGGAFSSAMCALLSGSCTVSYTPPINFANDITITANYGGDGTHSKSSSTSTIKATTLHPVTETITSSSETINPGTQVQLTTTIADSSSSPVTPSGIVSWNDNNMGGTFSQVSCVLSSAACAVSYTPPANYAGSITITANYAGDSSHNANKGQFTLAISHLTSTTTTVAPSTVTINQGTGTEFTATITDTSSLPTIPDGMVSWSDGGAGGTFSLSFCNLSSASCSVSYTPSDNPPNSLTITAEYAGNSVHSGSTGTSVVTV